jgi:two-component system sensor histidine kinase CpxA
MRSLFLKIFLSYWLAQALFVVLAIVVTLALRPTQDSPRMEYFRVSLGKQAVQAYEHGGQGELQKFLDDFHKNVDDHRAYLFDGNGEELSGRNPPAWAQKLAAEAGRAGGVKVQSDRRSAQPLKGASGGRYVLVMERPGPRPHFLFGPGHPPGLIISLAILTSGLVCFLLARSLTAPVVRLRAATQKLANGELSARAGSIPAGRRDEIAELVRDFDTMAERLENLMSAQSRLLNDISHELRSPLARLSVALGLARQRTGPEAASTLDRIELESNRLNELIGRLLALARMEGGEQAAQSEPVALGQLVREIAKDASFEAQGRKCRVKSEIIKDSVVMGSAALLHSAIENVVRNATRYTEENSEVEIQLDRRESGNGAQAVVRIADRGPGVPEESLDKLFRPFYRLDDARGRRTGGVGLGLSITDRAIRLHGGSVEAANRTGGGLVVEIRLPAEAIAEASKGTAEVSAVRG